MDNDWQLAYRVSVSAAEIVVVQDDAWFSVILSSRESSCSALLRAASIRCSKPNALKREHKLSINGAFDAQIVDVDRQAHTHTHTHTRQYTAALVW